MLRYYSSSEYDFGAFVHVPETVAAGEPPFNALILAFGDYHGRRLHVECQHVNGVDFDAHLAVPGQAAEFPQKGAPRTSFIGDVIAYFEGEQLRISYSFLPLAIGYDLVDFSPMPERIEGTLTLNRVA
jgi:hypothetical protein